MFEIASSAAASVLFLACIALGVFIIFFPLFRTVVGGLKILRVYGFRKSREAEVEKYFDSLMSDAELGLTMADGGEKTEKNKAGRTGNNNK